MNKITIKAAVIEQGRGFTDKTEWFVDCDGYAFGVFESEDEAKTRATLLAVELKTKTPREAYYGW